MIIHISGPAGSGKTHIGKYFKNKYDCIVKDLDDLWYEYIQEKSDVTYQEYIYNFIDDNKNNIIIFVGIDANKCLPNPEGKNEIIEKYDFKTKHLFYLRPNIKILISQRFKREVDKLLEQADKLINRYFDGEKDKITKKITRKVDIDFMIKNIEMCDSIYESNNYVTCTYEECLDNIEKLINNKN